MNSLQAKVEKSTENIRFFAALRMTDSGEEESGTLRIASPTGGCEFVGAAGGIKSEKRRI
jgi:hypothetical protein